MRLDVYRYSDNGESTLGLLLIDGVFQCYTIEDTCRDVKIKGETRIPSGSYSIKLRTVGGHHSRYSKKFPDFHKGMLWLQNVPNFEYILIHIGNDKSATEGCLLVGNSSNNNNKKDGFISDSTGAYKDMYKKVLKSIEKGEPVSISYHDKIN